MLILTIETCTDTTTLGVVADGAVRVEAAFPSRYTLVKRLLTRLDWLLAEAGVTKEQLEMIDRRAIAPLVKTIERSVAKPISDNNVRSAAGDALEAITGKQFGPFEQNWRRAFDAGTL